MNLINTRFALITEVIKTEFNSSQNKKQVKLEQNHPYSIPFRRSCVYHLDLTQKKTSMTEVD